MEIVIGAGVGGLSAAIARARAGARVLVLEARDRAGGLAGSVDAGGRRFDAGPYILLDRPGLEWAFQELGADIGGLLDFIPLPEVYRVERPDGPTVTLHHDLDATVAGFERDFPGSGPAYRAFVARMTATYERLAPLQRRGRPGPLALLGGGRFLEIPFLLRGLAHHLGRDGLPGPIQDALGIWTHIAGQPLAEAPAPLAFVPAIVHGYGAWTVRGGIRRIPEVLEGLARAVGVEIRTGAPVGRIVRDGRRVLGVEVDGERIDAERVFSDVGVATYASLLDPPDPAQREAVAALPLQSPGIAAYILADGVDPALPFLRFRLPPGEKVRLLVNHGAVDPDQAGLLRIVHPVDHGWAERVGPDGQRAHLERILAEPWWREGLDNPRVVLSRIPADWGRAFHLHRDSMNPVMTAAFMRRGRLPHRSPVADNLFLAGSATHPGQWVSFCAISGVLAAREAG